MTKSRFFHVRRSIAIGASVIVVGVLGLLSLATVTMHGDTKASMYATAVQSDLRNLSSAESLYFTTHGVFASDLSALRETFTTSAGVSIHIDQADARSWRATASHSLLTRTCTIGADAPPKPSPTGDDIARACPRDETAPGQSR